MSKYLDKPGLEHYHDLIKSGLYEYIEGTQSSATSTWTGVSTQPSLSAGKLIIYHLPYAGGSAVPTLNLTLPDNTTTGAKTVGTRVGTSYSAGSNIILVYTGTAWDVVEADGSNLIANRAVVSDANGKLAESNVTSTELGYLSGVTSGVQGQIDNAVRPITNYYWWKRYSDYQLTRKGMSLNDAGFNYNYMSSSVSYACIGSFSSDQTPSVVQYGDSVTLNETTGEIEIDNPTTFTINANVGTLTSKYIKFITIGDYANNAFNKKDVYYISSSYPIITGGSSSTRYYLDQRNIVYTVSADLGTDVEYISSSSINAYPDKSALNGYYYEFCGIPLDMILNNGGLRLETMDYTYTTTGTSEEPVELEFDGYPLIFCINSPTYLTSGAQYRTYLRPLLYLSKTYRPLSAESWESNYTANLTYGRRSGKKVQLYRLKGTSGSTYNCFAITTMNNPD